MQTMFMCYEMSFKKLNTQLKSALPEFQAFVADYVKTLQAFPDRATKYDPLIKELQGAQIQLLPFANSIATESTPTLRELQVQASTMADFLEGQVLPELSRLEKAVKKRDNWAKVVA